MEVDDFKMPLWKPHSYIFSKWRAHPTALDVKLTKEQGASTRVNKSGNKVYN